MDSHDIENYFRQHRKTLAVIFLAVGVLAISGLFMGMRQTESQVNYERFPLPENHESHTGTQASEIPAAPKYMQIPAVAWKANHDWQFTLADLPRAEEPAPNAPAPDTRELLAAIERRASLRAYDGAPPVIPHAIDNISSASCSSCHGVGEKVVIGGKRPAEMSHPWVTNCTSCHVPADGMRRFTEPVDSRLVVANDFTGKPSPGHGTRAYTGAPPTLPHPVWMRQNCMACHGPGREQAIRSSHPQRRNCLQCHAPNSAFDNRESFLPPPPPIETHPVEP